MWRSLAIVEVVALAFVCRLTHAIPFQGVNLAGLEFYAPDPDSGSVQLDYNYSRFLPNENGSFAFQISHFTGRGYNMFRIPFSWQRLQPTTDGISVLNATYLNYIHEAVNLITSRNGSVILDVHNYARVQGRIIGEDKNGPSAESFANFWVQFAQLWRNESRVWFGLMNEPHNLNMSVWTRTIQLVVNRIRMHANSTNIILLPGTDYTGLDNWLSGSYPYLRNVTDPFNTSTLIYDIHHYWDGKGGATSDCNASLPSSLFPNVTAILRRDARRAFLSETGWGNGSSCDPYITSTLQNLDNPSWLGYTAWGAGEFAATPEQYSYDFDRGKPPGGQNPDQTTLSPNPITRVDTPQFRFLDPYRNGSLYCICKTGYCPSGGSGTNAAVWQPFCQAQMVSKQIDAPSSMATNTLSSSTSASSVVSSSPSSASAQVERKHGKKWLLLAGLMWAFL